MSVCSSPRRSPSRVVRRRQAPRGRTLMYTGSGSGIVGPAVLTGGAVVAGSQTTFGPFLCWRWASRSWPSSASGRSTDDASSVRARSGSAPGPPPHRSGATPCRDGAAPLGGTVARQRALRSPPVVALLGRPPALADGPLTRPAPAVDPSPRSAPPVAPRRQHDAVPRASNPLEPSTVTATESAQILAFVLLVVFLAYVLAILVPFLRRRRTARATPTRSPGTRSCPAATKRS